MKNPKSTQEHKAKQMSFLDSTKKYRKDESKHNPSTTKKIQTSSVVPSREKASKIQQIWQHKDNIACDCFHGN